MTMLITKEGRRDNDEGGKEKIKTLQHKVDQDRYEHTNIDITGNSYYTLPYNHGNISKVWDANFCV